MVPEGVESDFGLQGWIDTLELKQIVLIFSLYTLETYREIVSIVDRTGNSSHYIRPWLLKIIIFVFCDEAYNHNYRWILFVPYIHQRW